MFDFQSAPLTFILLGLNVVISLYVLYVQPSLLDKLSFRPNRVVSNMEWHRMITGSFLHGSLGHLAFNMIALFLFGRIHEMILGSVKFGILYFGAALIAHMFALIRHRNTPGYAAVGASGAISGVVFGYCLFFPLSKIYLLFIPVGIYAIVFAVLFAGYSYYASVRDSGSGIFGRLAHEAHLGGALGGFLLTLILEPSAARILIEELSQFF